MKASDLFIRAFESEGVEYVFGVPGEENLDLLDSLRESGIRLVLTRHEQAAGFMAATVGRLTGKAGVALSTLGPGATNLVTAAAYGQLGAMPMVMVTGQKPIRNSKQGRFQIIDIVDMMQPITKMSHQIVSGDTVASRVREAFRVAQEERPGATHLELPEDVAQDTTDASVLPASSVRRPVAEEKSVHMIAARIGRAKRPLLLIGAAANRNLTCKMLSRFVEQTGIPFFTTQMGKGVVDERHPHFLGNAALSDGDFVHRAIARADLIVNVGHDVVEKPPFFMRSGGPEVVHVNYFTAQVDPVYFPQFELVGDIANSVQRLAEALASREPWDFSAFRDVKTMLDAHLAEDGDDPGFPVLPQRLVADVRRVMPSEGIVALDNGIYKIWFARNYPAHRPNTVLLDNALAAMGAGLPSAIAAKLVRPQAPVMAVCGDGGLMMSSQEIETAVRLGLDLVVLVLRDDAYGMIKWKQSDLGFASFGLDFGNPDFVALARSYGAEGHRIESAEELADCLRACQRAGGMHVVDVPVDYSRNVEDLNRGLRSRSAALKSPMNQGK